MAKTVIKNLNDLGLDLLSVYSELRDGSIERSTADGLANVAGKIINSLKVQVEYNSLKSNIDKVPLLETTDSSLLLNKVPEVQNNEQ